MQARADPIKKLTLKGIYLNLPKSVKNNPRNDNLVRIIGHFFIHISNYLCLPAIGSR